MNYKKLFKDIPEVNFMGATTNISTYLQDANYLIQLSDNEGFCYSVYEALSMGVPVIVSEWEGVQDIVTNGKNGYIIEMDMSNLDINLFYEAKPSYDTVKRLFFERYLKTQKQLAVNKWHNLIENL